MQRIVAFIIVAVMIYCGGTEIMGYTVAKASENIEAEEAEEEITENEDIDEETENEEIDEEMKKECIYNVSFPTGSKAFLDPENLSGKGQIFSDDFKVENYGNTDVAIKIKNIEVYYKSTGEVYEFSEEEVSDRHSYVKKLNVDVVWRNEQENAEKVLSVLEGASDEYVLFLKASEYDENEDFIRLNDGSTGLFYFTGTLNSNPDIVWEDGEVVVSFDYEIENVEENVEENILEIEKKELEQNGRQEAVGEEEQPELPDALEGEEYKEQAEDGKKDGEQNQPGITGKNGRPDPSVNDREEEQPKSADANVNEKTVKEEEKK